MAQAFRPPVPPTAPTAPSAPTPPSAAPAPSGTPSHSRAGAVGPLASELVSITDTLARGQFRLVTAAAAFADSHEWIIAGSPTAAHWLAAVADVEVCTAREWIRIGTRLRDLPAIADAFAARRISYSKVRALTRLATPDNEDQLLRIALTTAAGDLARALARWLHDVSDPEDLDAYHQANRSVRWRTEPDGMVTFTMRFPPLLAGMLIAFVNTWVMRSGNVGRPTKRGNRASGGVAAATQSGEGASAGAPSAAQQYADAIEALLGGAAPRGIGVRAVHTEVVLHVRGDGCTLDDGTPVPESVVERIAPEAFIRALVHDAEGRPINASGRRRHPTRRQKRLVKERDRSCVDCGRTDLLEYDHVPPYSETGRTVTEELELRCAPCHHKRHGA